MKNQSNNHKAASEPCRQGGKAVFDMVRGKGSLFFPAAGWGYLSQSHYKSSASVTHFRYKCFPIPQEELRENCSL